MQIKSFLNKFGGSEELNEQEQYEEEDEAVESDELRLLRAIDYRLTRMEVETHRLMRIETKLCRLAQIMGVSLEAPEKAAEFQPKVRPTRKYYGERHDYD